MQVPDYVSLFRHGSVQSLTMFSLLILALKNQSCHLGFIVKLQIGLALGNPVRARGWLWLRSLVAAEFFALSVIALTLECLAPLLQEFVDQRTTLDGACRWAVYSTLWSTGAPIDQLFARSRGRTGLPETVFRRACRCAGMRSGEARWKETWLDTPRYAPRGTPTLSKDSAGEIGVVYGADIR